MAHRGAHARTKGLRKALFTERVKQLNTLKRLTSAPGYQRLARNLRFQSDISTAQRNLRKLASDSKRAYEVGKDASHKVASLISRAHDYYKGIHPQPLPEQKFSSLIRKSRVPTLGKPGGYYRK